MPTYAVGDIQGCLQPLKKLLDHVGFGSGDYLWIAGDLINRGPQSLQTLRFIYSIKDLVQIVLGNHDLHLLAHHAVFQDAPVNKTLQPIMQAHDRNQLLSWLQNQPMLHHDQALDTVMTHAGIPPYWDLSHPDLFPKIDLRLKWLRRCQSSSHRRPHSTNTTKAGGRSLRKK